MTAISLLLQIAGVTCIILTQDYLGLILAGVVFGLGFGAVMPLWSILLGAIFGRHAFARIMGFMTPLILPFTLLGFPFATFVFEQTGSYLPAYTALIGAFIVAGIALLFLKVPDSTAGNR